MLHRLGIAAVLCIAVATKAAAQQYRAVVLSQKGDAQAAAGGKQYGSIEVPTGPHAAIWSNSADSLEDVDPGIGQGSVLGGSDGTTAVGTFFAGGTNQAGLFVLSSHTWINLHPAAYFYSAAVAVSGTAQVGRGGYFASTLITHALLWHGSAESVVDLTPGDLIEGHAHGVYGNVQVGYRGELSHAWIACLWTGTAKSRVDLHPAGASNSVANGIFGNEQVGYFDDQEGSYACLWHGTAQSCVSLAPPGYRSTVAYATDGVHQVGYGFPSPVGNERALVWTGSPASVQELHSLLPSEFNSSGATGIDPVTGAISGWAYSVNQLGSFAIVWLPLKPLTGHVTLSNHNGPIAGQSITIEVRNAGTTTVVDSYTTALDASGNFAVTTTLFGNYDVAVKSSHWLRKVAQNVTFDQTGAGSGSLTLVNGDVNGDNAVTLGDFAQLRAAFGSSSGDPTWNPSADLNGDGAVTLGDFAILRSHFGESGDQ